jgi:phospholipid-binding lipoprotein MlaA
MTNHKSLPLAAACAVALLALSGCATVTTPTPGDPLEGANRTIFKFNDAVDRAVLKPVAQGYNWALPQGVRNSVTNVFDNVGDAYTMANDLLQGKIADGTEDLMRVVINSFFGIGGLFDIASQAGLPKHNEDFGLTLARYGVPPGPYLVVPLLGPSTLRDSSDFVVTYFADPISYIKPDWVSVTLYGVRLVNTRANLLGASDLLSDAALDKYSFVRNAYLQRRQSENTGGSNSTASLPVYDDESTPAAVSKAAPVAAAKPSAASDAVGGAAMPLAPAPLSGPVAAPAAPASGPGVAGGEGVAGQQIPPLGHYFPGLRLR